MEPLAMAVLVHFAENPNKVVSLEELIQHVWKGRIVGDHAIYRVINQIRKILGEDQNNAYITTIRKKGYQLVQPVQWQAAPDPGSPAPTQTSIDQAPLSPTRTNSTKFLSLLVALPLLVAAFWVGSYYLTKSASYRAMQAFNLIKPFSVLIGQEKDAAYSPDGHSIAYAHRAKGEPFFKLYVQSVDGESPRQLTRGSGDDTSPSWSPDGSSLVFVRHHEGQCQIMQMKTHDTNTTASPVVDCHASGLPNEVVWGQDEHIYYTDSLSAVDPYKIYKYSTKTSKREQLTNPESGKSKGDIHIALSNDNRRLAFSRDLNWGNTEVNVLDLHTSRITTLFNLNGWRKALAWSHDGEFLYYIDTNDDVYAYSLKHKFHKQVLGNTDTLHAISAHPLEDKLAIMTGETGVDIWGRTTDASDTDEPVIQSSEIDLYPELANQSDDVAFMSLRSGQPQIWIRSKQREYQLSKFTDGRLIPRLRWSPDDSAILATTDTEVYTFDVAKKTYQTIWQGSKPSRIETASWALDGKSIYFSSDLDGDWQIYQKQLGTDEPPVKITERGGYAPELTANGDMLFYKYHQNGIWKMNLADKSVEKLVNDTNIYAYDALYARGNGFYYLSIGKDTNTLTYVDLTTRDRQTLFPILNPLLDYTISADQKRVLFPKFLNEETEIKILEKRH
ncbi:hypothetical protein GCM10008090_20060 [Arenicella chitinivorans]|uniref:OmpR/PhoB-type domain-containing protein n=1 Tax=Arenicella chitinivorans TaxID=1329800 RepID=A0A918RSA4_9GAMM|nr:hypothetical protein GCM10008090_20060 [Arenicella chitinivorans]